MKSALVFLSILACVSAIPAHIVESDRLSKTLDDDFAELIKLLPRSEILNILIKYLAEDSEVREIAEFLYTDEFEAIVVAIDAEPTFVAILNFLETEGVQIYDLLNDLHRLLRIPEISKPFSKSQRGVQKGWSDMWDEILAVMPLEDLYDFHCGKLAAGQEWNTLFDHLSGEEFHSMINAFRVTDSCQTFLTKMAEFDIHTEVVLAALQRLLNWDGDNVDFCVNYVPPMTS